MYIYIYGCVCVYMKIYIYTHIYIRIHKSERKIAYSEVWVQFLGIKIGDICLLTQFHIHGELNVPDNMQRLHQLTEIKKIYHISII